MHHGKWECNTWTADLFTVGEGLLVACDSTLALALDHDLSMMHALWRPWSGAVFSSRFGDGTADPAAAFPLLGWHRIITGRDQLLIRGFVLTTAAVQRAGRVLVHQALGSRPKVLAELLSACASFPRWACPGRIIIPGAAHYRGKITLQTFNAESIRLNPALYEAWSNW